MILVMVLRQSNLRLLGLCLFSFYLCGCSSFIKNPGYWQRTNIKEMIRADSSQTQARLDRDVTICQKQEDAFEKCMNKKGWERINNLSEENELKVKESYIHNMRDKNGAQTLEPRSYINF